MADNFARLKYRWLDRIMHDVRLSPMTRLVGYEIACHINRACGEAWPSQETIRRKLGFKNVSQVKRGIADLRALRYIDVSFDRATRSNTYLANLANYDGGATATRGATATIEGGASAPTWGRGNGFDGGASAPLSYLKESLYEQEAASPTQPSDPNRVRWLSVKNRLAISLSPAVVKSWFGQVDVVAITANEVVLVCPSRFSRTHIENNHLGDRLSEAWRAELPSIDRVRLVDPPIARAAE